MKILVSGGCGYIGSHTCVELLNNGYEVVVVDNLCNSKENVIDKIKEITGKNVTFYKGDVCDKEILRKIFNENKIDAVIHFAGLKAVGESVEKPLMYYRNNIDSTLSLCEVMNEYNCKKIIFSSSATVYGDPAKLPITEDMPVGNTTNPYGSSKLYIEGILKDLYISDNSWGITLLRYFNPVGAHQSGLIGEDPNGIPNNLMPYIVKVATGELPCLSIFGDDYDTKDGTGVRDYIHVVDLARGHVKALEKLLSVKGINIYNLGTGNGYSVLEMVNTFSKVNGVDVNYKIVERRAGDIACCYADCSKAFNELGWSAELSLDDMVKSAYNFVLKNKK
ncbi:MAG: UDP-glucose 4-epimerase GalE [Bacilli bacterium]|nr:UDP-glucose 4-epimerase GalE [Bacilli bacterium]